MVLVVTVNSLFVKESLKEGLLMVGGSVWVRIKESDNKGQRSGTMKSPREEKGKIASDVIERALVIIDLVYVIIIINYPLYCYNSANILPFMMMI